MDNLEDEIAEVERLLGLTARQFVRSRLVLLLSDLQQVCNHSCSLILSGTLRHHESNQRSCQTACLLHVFWGGGYPCDCTQSCEAVLRWPCLRSAIDQGRLVLNYGLQCVKVAAAAMSRRDRAVHCHGFIGR